MTNYQNLQLEKHVALQLFTKGFFIPLSRKESFYEVT